MRGIVIDHLGNEVARRRRRELFWQHRFPPVPDIHVRIKPKTTNQVTSRWGSNVLVTKGIHAVGECVVNDDAQGEDVNLPRLSLL